MAEKLFDTEVDYEGGYLHFCKKTENGKVAVYRARMKNAKKKE